MKKDQSQICVQSKAFALRIIQLYRYLTEDRKEYVLSKQILRSGTGIGANVHEATQAQSRADFISKLSIALKEASETEYWLQLLAESSLITKKQGEDLMRDLVSILRMLTASIKTTKSQKSSEPSTCHLSPITCHLK